MEEEEEEEELQIPLQSATAATSSPKTFTRIVTPIGAYVLSSRRSRRGQKEQNPSGNMNLAYLLF
jgi:hypothetical protein